VLEQVDGELVFRQTEVDATSRTCWTSYCLVSSRRRVVALSNSRNSRFQLPNYIDQSSAGAGHGAWKWIRSTNFDMLGIGVGSLVQREGVAS
jgi:hypothetical protein